MDAENSNPGKVLPLTLNTETLKPSRAERRAEEKRARQEITDKDIFLNCAATAETQLKNIKDAGGADNLNAAQTELAIKLAFRWLQRLGNIRAGAEVNELLVLVANAVNAARSEVDKSSIIRI